MAGADSSLFSRPRHCFCRSPLPLPPPVAVCRSAKTCKTVSPDAAPPSSIPSNCPRQPCCKPRWDDAIGSTRNHRLTTHAAVQQSQAMTLGMTMISTITTGTGTSGPVRLVMPG